jgi:topoisomerase-4 subunit B
MEPVFESQTKTKLGSADMGSEVGMPSVRTFINDFVKTKLDNYYKKYSYCGCFIAQNSSGGTGAKKLSGIRKLAKDRAKKSNLQKLKRLSRTSYGYENPRNLESTLLSLRFCFRFHHEISRCEYAGFSLRGKPLNSYGMNKNCL